MRAIENLPATMADPLEVSLGPAEKIQWYQSPIEKETLYRLMKRSDWHGFRQAGLTLLLLATTGGVVFYASRQLSWPWVVAALYLHGTFYAFTALGTASHELCHRTVFKTRFWNEWFLRVFSFLGWFNYCWFRSSHVKHHQVTVHSGLDLEVILPKKFGWKEVLYMFTVNVTGLTGIYTVFRNAIRHSLGILEGEWEQRIFPESNPKLRRELFNWARCMLLGHLVLAGLFIYFQIWIMLLVVTFAPFYATWLGMLCVFPQHAGLSSNVPDFRLCCRTMILHPFLSFLYWQMNYHTEHHMYAAVPFYQLKHLHKALKADMPPPPRGLWATWKQLRCVLHRQHEDPNYVFVPVLPIRNSPLNPLTRE
jgi:fatty acid desaturase